MLSQDSENILSCAIVKFLQSPLNPNRIRFHWLFQRRQCTREQFCDSFEAASSHQFPSTPDIICKLLKNNFPTESTYLYKNMLKYLTSLNVLSFHFPAECRLRSATITSCLYRVLKQLAQPQDCPEPEMAPYFTKVPFISHVTLIKYTVILKGAVPLLLCKPLDGNCIKHCSEHL